MTYSYKELFPAFVSEAPPQPVQSPTGLFYNAGLSQFLNLDPDMFESNYLTYCSGNEPIPGQCPYAMAYAGHQFGYFVPSLGDGRATVIGEVIAQDNKVYLLQLKGSGRTRYSRNGDGRSALGPVIREYLVSEAMHALGIPTTRSLAAVATGETVYRESALPGGILTRVSPCLIRIGTFEYAAYHGGEEAVQRLAEYCMTQFYPECLTKGSPYLSFLEEVIQAQATLVAKWMSVGFIHGVMNTDNTSIIEQTIDYGPCAFMDVYDPNTVFSYIDRDGRYAYKNQPQIMKWNLTRLAQILLPLIEKTTTMDAVLDCLNRFDALYDSAWTSLMCRKLALASSEDKPLIDEFLDILYVEKRDYTETFRALSCIARGESLADACFDSARFQAWIMKWKAKCDDTLVTQLDVVNPIYIPRNHCVERAIHEAVESDDLTFATYLLSAVQQPYHLQLDDDYIASGPPPGEEVQVTFCGT